MSALDIRGFGHGFAARSGWSEVLRNIDIHMGAGEFFCLLGPSGCGKSTLLNAIAGFLTPTKGSIELDGKTIAGPGNDRVVVFQDVHNSLFPWMTVRENVEFGLRMLGLDGAERRERVRAYLQLVGLGEHDEKFPDELSGGMKQRVQIARALAIRPKILLMDEPFASLDAQTRRTMQSEIIRIWSQTGTSVFFITHDIIEAVTLGDRVGVLSRAPGSTLRRIIDIDLPRPRTLTDASVAACVASVEELLGLETSHV